jgi:hypothetical protein
MVRLRACWVTQRPSGFDVQATYSIRRVASEMKKRDVNLLHEDGVDGEEVAGEHAPRLRTKERAPRGIRPLRSWLQPFFEQHLAD